jgi:hypothetical protein
MPATGQVFVDPFPFPFALTRLKVTTWLQRLLVLLLLPLLLITGGPPDRSHTLRLMQQQLHGLAKRRHWRDKLLRRFLPVRLCKRLRPL